MGKTVDFLVGMILGAVVGGGVTLLLAPRRGEETREAIRGRIDLVIEEGRRAAAERRAELEAQFAEAKSLPRP